MVNRAIVTGLLLTTGFACDAGAATITSSFAAWQATVGNATVTATQTTGLFDPLALNLPTTSVVPLADGQVLHLSTPAQVTEPQNGFPFLLTNGFAGDLLIPQDAAGNQVLSETITPTNSVSAFGFEVVPFSSNLGGPYSVSARLAGGQVVSASLPGGDFNSGTTQAQFFGVYGGSIASLTISTNDPNGFAFGDFVDVPEPASMSLLMAGLTGVLCLARRRAERPGDVAPG